MPYYKIPHFSLWNYIPNMTLSADTHVKAFIKSIPAEAVIVDIGAGGRHLSDRIITVDKFIMENTDICADIHNLPFADNSIDCIICTGTLEHIENPWIAAAEFKRVLKKGGVCYVGTPFMQGYHPDPTDYWRFTLEGLTLLFGKFTLVDKGVLQGGGSGLSWALVDFFRSMSDNRVVSETLGVMSRFVFFWVKYMDILLSKNQNNRLFASGYYLICRKED